MTIDEIIKDQIDMAKLNENRAERWKERGDNEAAKLNNKLAADHRQLAEWLTELKEAKRLLKLAVEGYNFIGHITKDYACPSAISCSACPMDEGKQCRIWEHADEALALISKDIDVPASADDTNVGHKSGGWISCKNRLPEITRQSCMFGVLKTGMCQCFTVGIVVYEG